MKIYCDSSTREACFVVEGQEPVVVSYLEPVTVNVGEYKAVILALKEAKRLKLEQVELLTDSQLVVKQVNGEWKCRKRHLLPLRDRVRELIDWQPWKIGCFLVFPYRLGWIPREENLAGRVLEP